MFTTTTSEKQAQTIIQSKKPTTSGKQADQSCHLKNDYFWKTGKKQLFHTTKNTKNAYQTKAGLPINQI